MNDLDIMTEQTELSVEPSTPQEEQTEYVTVQQDDEQEKFEAEPEEIPEQPQEPDDSGAADEPSDELEPSDLTDPLSDKASTPDYQAEISSLRARVEALQAELEARTAAMERMSRECAEFSQLYPDKSLASLPAEVWESVRDGIPLAAAYAYSEAKQRHRQALAAEVNDRNRSASSGGVSGSSPDFLTPGEVRRMSAAQVRENYTKIIESMKLWS